MRLLIRSGDEIFISVGEIILALNRANEGPAKEYVHTAGKGSQIVALTVSTDGLYLFASFANKQVCCWDTTTCEILGSTTFGKRPTALVYCKVDNDKSALVVSDKAGLLWGVDVPYLKKQVLLAGHTASVITDMEMCDSIIATADRDEKIRITSFPKMTTIVSFCMGHTSVVTSISFLSVNGDTLLVSTGWDHKLCLWNPHTGEKYTEKVLQTSSSVPAISAPDSTNTNAEVSAGNDEGKLSDDSPSAVKGGEKAVEVEVRGEGEAADVLDPEAIVADKDDEGPEERTYDEASAGHYPLRVLASQTQPLVAIIYKDKPMLSLFPVIKSNDTSSSTIVSTNSSGDADKPQTPASYYFGKEHIIDLPGLPCDICFSADNRLYVTLPKPICFQMISIRVDHDAASDEVIISSNSCASGDFEQKFQEKCGQYGECLM
jgi:WD40 repeat protein